MPTAMRTTNMGVSELRMLANELSIFFAIADAKKKAGKRLPVTPDRIIRRSFSWEFF
jgi:hypothetical protein